MTEVMPCYKALQSGRITGDAVIVPKAGIPQGLKSPHVFWAFAAPLKWCPVTKHRSMIFQQAVKSCPVTKRSNDVLFQGCRAWKRVPPGPMKMQKQRFVE
jgi:hypothetical protein